MSTAKEQDTTTPPTLPKTPSYPPVDGDKDGKVGDGTAGERPKSSL